MQLRSGFRGNSRAYLRLLLSHATVITPELQVTISIAAKYCGTPFPAGSTVSDRQFPRDQPFLVLHTDFGTAASNDDSNDDSIALHTVAGWPGGRPPLEACP